MYAVRVTRVKLATGISETVGEVAFPVTGLVPLGKAVGRLSIGAPVRVPENEADVKADVVFTTPLDPVAVLLPPTTAEPV